MAIKIAVAVYLVWIAMGVWRRSLTLGDGASVRPVHVFVATLLNPKAVILALTIFPAEPFAPPAQTAAFIAVAFATGLGWIALGRALGAATGETGAWLIPKTGAVALGGFAGLILYSAFG